MQKEADIEEKKQNKFRWVQHIDVLAAFVRESPWSKRKDGCIDQMRKQKRPPDLF